MNSCKGAKAKRISHEDHKERVRQDLYKNICAQKRGCLCFDAIMKGVKKFPH